MAPDRGAGDSASSAEMAVAGSHDQAGDHELSSSRLAPQRSRKSGDLDRVQSDMGCYATPCDPGSALELDNTNFTFRGVLVGTAIGVIIAASNTYFGLQTGWISGMAMPASLIGFAFFKTISRHIKLPFTPVENVLVQTVAGAVGTMPLGLGFVGVIPSLQFLLKSDEGAPVDLSLWRLIVWGLGLCLFGVVFGVPLRKQVIVRERLKFPSGTATALMISVLHGGAQEKSKDSIETQGTEEREGLLREREQDDSATTPTEDRDTRADWKDQVKLLFEAFAGSGAYTLIQYFVPVLHKLPIFGSHLAKTWVWTLNPSPAYVGQGIIMGPATTFHMLLGAVVGWAVLSPIAKHQGWAPGPVADWETGSKGWIVWVSLAIMLADAVVNLGWLFLRPIIHYGPGWYSSVRQLYRNSPDMRHSITGGTDSAYAALTSTESHQESNDPNEARDDAPPHHLVSGRTVLMLLPLTIILCIVCIHVTFGEYIPIPLNILAILLALVLSIMGVRALGETDLNPVSGISKLTQLVFAVLTPRSKNAIVINLLAGAVSEAGALQAGDILQDLKAGHLIGASPRAQFYGQIIGSVVGAFVSAAVYKLYVKVYTIPGDLFQVPTAYVWIFTARLVTGKGLPPVAGKFALGAGAIFALTTCLRIYLSRSQIEWHQRVLPFIPGGIAVAVGMYNTPSFTLARTAGGIIAWYWTTWKGRGETRVIVLASGLILGEGVVSIINLVMASLGVPHL